ncbi:hypothetical protein SAMN05421788_10391 [Filimonas lacunae]|uniref:Uncharacterized protein n=1 Tax=Filimonas lacunae TaxID=477680 RepID=A0A173MJT8_9BACT|nr:hypothetical protein [Filimonas lacunae]BAV07739.1 hypothetical protein FLA_3770 [Filimonas lacunae]SIT04266.1 hypothetical protein SAMN05421788_10391 [Filimonas lacunae]
MKTLRYKDDSVAAIISTPTIRIHKSWRTAFLMLCVMIKLLLLYCGYLMARTEMLQKQVTIVYTSPQH